MLFDVTKAKELRYTMGQIPSSKPDNRWDTQEIPHILWFTRACHWTLSWANWSYSTASHSLTL